MRDFFEALVETVRPIADRLGLPGLTLVTLLDSSFLSLPEVADGLIVLAVLHRPYVWASAAFCATLGSVAGCYALYFVARRGGESFLLKCFNAKHVEKALTTLRRFGLLAIVVPSMLPPPVPFKIFVLLSGVANMPARTFLMAVALGRGFRYGGIAWLSYHYGDSATRYIQENLPVVSAAAAAVILAGVVGVFVFRRRWAA